MLVLNKHVRLPCNKTLALCPHIHCVNCVDILPMLLFFSLAEPSYAMYRYISRSRDLHLKLSRGPLGYRVMHV